MKRWIILLFMLVAVPLMAKKNEVVKPDGPQPGAVAPDEHAVVGTKTPPIQQFKLKAIDLDVSGAFPLNTAHPFKVNGYDKYNRPYSISVVAKEISPDIFQITYELKRLAQTQSGSVTIEVGKTGRVSTVHQDSVEHDLHFESKIVE